MRTVCGTIKIDFIANVSGKFLLEEFSEFMLNYGTVNLVNVHNREIELVIDEHEITILNDEEGDGNDARDF